jgi:hypothetical protein
MRWTLWWRETSALKRTAKACGPDAPTLALRSRSLPRTTGAKEPGPRGERDISRKPSYRECRLIAAYLWLLTRVLFCCTRGRGCIAHPAFPAPSVLQKAGNSRINLAQTCGEIAKLRLLLPRPVLTGRGWGEGLSPRTQRLERAPHPKFAAANFDLSPQAGRGDLKGFALGSLKIESEANRGRHHPPTGPAFGRPDDRLRRMIQYSRDGGDYSKGRSVLDIPAFAGYDGWV